MLPKTAPKTNDMAQVHPPLQSIRPMTPGEHAELAILTLLAQGLGNAYELFHGVNWTSVQPGHDLHGELDIVVVNSAGDVALLEVKSGEVFLNGQGAFKRYGAATKDVGRQVRTQFDAVLHRLRSDRLGSGRLLHLLVLPDQRVDGPGTVAFPRERIIDAAECVDLCGHLQRTLGAGRPDAAAKQGVCDFFANRLGLETDVSVLSGSLRSRTARIAGGLAQWVPRIDAPLGIVRVQATAGSGKTQLALRLLSDARRRGQQVAYVCFNRPLADHMRDIAPQGTLAMSFHQLCWEAAGRPQQGGADDFGRLAQRYVESTGQAPAAWDLLVIDELQDLHTEWVQALVARLRGDGQLYLLDDPSQCLYEDRDDLDVAQAVVVRSQENFRSPRRLVETINLLRLSDDPVQPCSPFDGDMPGLCTYHSEGGSLVRSTAQAVQRCLDRGHALGDIAVLCWRGLEHSRLMGLERLQDWRLARFSGQYDAQGRPVWNDGELRIETVRRFKGQSADAIVLTEVDFEALDELRRRLLFVALTRARMHLEIVLTAAAEKALMARAQDAA